jgi:hypothetical protein
VEGVLHTLEVLKDYRDPSALEIATGEGNRGWKGRNGFLDRGLIATRHEGGKVCCPPQGAKKNRKEGRG